MNTFEAGDGPVLLNNVSCSQTHTRLSQCVHPGDVGINCCQDGTAGVSCEAAVSSSESSNLIVHNTFTPQISMSIATGTFISSLDPCRLLDKVPPLAS